MEAFVTRNMILGWALLMALFLGWTQYKGQQARKVRQLQTEQMVADSLAKLAAAPTATREAVLSAGKDPVGPALAATPDAGRAPAPTTTPAEAEHRVITVDAGTFTAVLDARGARIAELRVPSIGGKVPYNPVLIRPESEGALTLSLNGTDLENTVWNTDTEETWFSADSQAVTVTFSTVLPGNIPVTRSYTFAPGEPFIRHRFTAPEGTIRSYAVEWKGGLEETDRLTEGQGIGLTATYFSEVIYDNGSTVARESFTGDKSFNAQSGVLRWAGMRRKYVAVVLDFGRDVQDRLDATGMADPGKPKDAPHRYSLRVAGSADEKGALNFDLRVMPLHYATIRALDRNFEQILFTGWEWFLRADVWYVKLCGLVLNLLNMFFSWIPNYGIAIILLTLLVRFITLPLSINQTRQAAKLAVHQPEIRKIQEKFKGERQKMQAEIMGYYQKQGINPMAPVLGCFPLLLQMPVFIALFNVLGRAVELHETPFFGWIGDLSRPDVIWAGLKIPFIFPVGLTVLPFLMAATMWVQMKMTIKDPNQKAMIWLMPVIMFVFSGSFPSGLVLYWTISNVFTIGQTKVFGTVPPPAFPGSAPAKSSPSVTISPAPAKKTTGKTGGKKTGSGR
jgi:YidC/Oxa1 family membrane protein insertase